MARRNADRHGVGRRVSFRTGDLLRGLDSVERPFDAILANPPYVVDRARPALQPEVRDFEPAVALFGGSDGLELITRLVAEAPRKLRPGGYLVFEFGLGQDVEIEELLAGRARARAGRRPARSPGHITHRHRAAEL